MTQDQPGDEVKRRTRAPQGSSSLAEIAEIAEVSEATVSRVLNRKYGVSAATRQAVEDALRKVGYERPMSNELVVLLTPNLTNPIFARQAERIENVLSPYGLKTIICPVYPGTVQERDYVTALMDSGVAAIVFLSSSNTIRNADHRVVQLIASRGIPYVSINGGFPDAESPVVSTDDWRAAELAVAHLYDLGHRRIGLLAGPVGNIPADRRVEGFVEALEARGVDAEDLVVRNHFNIEGGQQAAATLLASGVTAMVASSDEMALGAYRAVERAGLTVPGHVSIIGYDDSPLLDYTAPPLTTVRQPVERIAEHVGRLTTSLIAKREVADAEILVEPEIRLRGSTAPVRPST
ncbi:LacI family DNA-binding transcriptional regulator [Homoserinibacter sp. GY 40078]|uniref:LacI family DNA-binding transcriptional regulator n=1 Tax=Homoserinibacter sp. GY 40078 TaxID=2603275 RepID=UPI0011CBBF96|nr:LacI family DNA-binding transcriptional regulator [Homoserinibacter sp. GY 40078]TXK18556.1 substrate-binding domain-containing protein [Homoserinibacter sp. GY 40078]